ncbi:extracellular solute-binding protein [uncultured Cohaesibacter sp.]|uniref:extracellular solute-binding protein n=1 Tax=uncultured Cohaesibacter sp. TaxID=1002546 RepID=UPI0029C830D8|nr:extracellular solute-binding protein [uncultured Cohaesibacter sp.]
MPFLHGAKPGGVAGIDRRAFLRSSALAAIASAVFGAGLVGRPLVGWAAAELHGLSVFGPLKYPPGFAHFDYVEAHAQKGGRLVQSAHDWRYNQNPQTFNTLNGFVLKGDAPPRTELLFDTLTVRAFDEPDAVYCHLASSVSLSPDGNRYSFALRPEARFHDGSPVTTDDVAFSFNILKEKGHPNLRVALAELERAEVDDDRVVLVFSGSQQKQAAIDVSYMVPIFSKAYYETMDFDRSTLEPPLGSGPYRVGSVNAGSFIDYERDPDYWGKDLPTSIGHDNFDVVRMFFAREHTVLFEAFKKGDINLHVEFSSKAWATQYDFPAIKDGRVFKLELPDGQPSGAQGWFFNLRKPKFADPRTREAIALTFDFEWSNKNLFYGLYQRTESFFERTAMKASGPAEGKVLALLEPYRDQLDPAVFDEPYSPPKSDASGKDRKLLAKANRLLQEAGWSRNEKGWVNAEGELLDIELLTNSPAFERIVTPWINTLALLDIPLTFRLVDPSQFQSRVDNFDFDLVGRRYGLDANITPSSRSMWGSEAAESHGSNNIAGVADPVMDAMIEAAISAKTREDMIAAGQAIDRIWRAGHYWVPNWNKPVHTLGVWKGLKWIDSANLYEFRPERWWWKEA